MEESVNLDEDGGFEENDAVPEELDCDSLLVELEGARNTIKEMTEQRRREKDLFNETEEKRVALEKKMREILSERETSDEKANKLRGDLETEITRLKTILDKQVHLLLVPRLREPSHSFFDELDSEFANY